MRIVRRKKEKLKQSEEKEEVVVDPGGRERERQGCVGYHSCGWAFFSHCAF